MASRVWSHLCDYASTDTNGKASIIGEFDRVFARQVPFTYPFFYVSAKWEGNDGEQITLGVRITAPSKKVVGEVTTSPITIKSMDGGIGAHINNNSFIGFPFTEFGEYAIELLLNGNVVHIMSLTAVQLPQSAKVQ